MREDRNSMLPSNNCFCSSLKCGFHTNISWRNESIGCLLCWPGRGQPVFGGLFTIDPGIPEWCLALIIRAGLLGRGTRVLYPWEPWSRTTCPEWWVNNPRVFCSGCTHWVYSWVQARVPHVLVKPCPPCSAGGCAALPEIVSLPSEVFPLSYSSARSGTQRCCPLIAANTAMCCMFDELKGCCQLNYTVTLQ